MIENNILILLGYDYFKSLEKIINKKNIFCFIYKDYIKYFDSNNLQKLKDIMGTNLIISDEFKPLITEIIEQKRIDCLVTLGWRRILDLKDFEKVVLMVNVHPALLPEYKGYHPVPYVILNEEKVHGITAHLINEEVDAGDIVQKESFPINTFSTLRSLQYEVNKRMPEFLRKLFDKIIEGNIDYSPNMDADTIIIAPIRTHKDSEVYLNEPLDEVFKKVKASDPKRFPAYFMYNGEKVYIKMYRSKEVKRESKYDI